MTQVAWQELRFVCPREAAEAISARLEAGSALAVSLADAADRPIYEPGAGAMPLWQLTKVTALYPSGHPVTAEVELLRAQLGKMVPAAEIVTLEDQDWIRAGQQGFEARRFGERLWVVPSWDESPPRAEACVHIDPGLAFGTGAHPSTALCLEWLDAKVHPGLRVCDYGCGSGVLGIAAGVLGATLIDCTDIDEQALAATRANASANGIAGRLRTPATKQELRAPYDLVVANILAGPLLELAPTLCGLLAPSGELALAGLLAEQAEELVAGYEREGGVRLYNLFSRDGWTRLDFTRQWGGAHE